MDDVDFPTAARARGIRREALEREKERERLEKERREEAEKRVHAEYRKEGVAKAETIVIALAVYIRETASLTQSWTLVDAFSRWENKPILKDVVLWVRNLWKSPPTGRCFSPGDSGTIVYRSFREELARVLGKHGYNVGMVPEEDERILVWSVPDGYD